MAARQPTLFIPHGGGPCFFMPDPKGHWTGMGEFLRSLPSRLPEPPKAILVVSAHWETSGFRLTGGSGRPLVYDYHGFPPETYAIRYDAPGAPQLAAGGPPGCAAAACRSNLSRSAASITASSCR